MSNILIALVISLLAAVQQPGVPVQLQIEGLNLANQILIVEQELPATSTPDLVDNSTDSMSTVTITEPAPTKTAPQVQQDIQQSPVIGNANPAPTCTLSAQIVNAFGTTWQSELQWSFTDGATAAITGTSTTVANLEFGQNNPVPSGYSFPSTSSFLSPIYALNPQPPEADYVMTVSLNGQQGQCEATTTVPTARPTR